MTAPTLPAVGAKVSGPSEPPPRALVGLSPPAPHAQGSSTMARWALAACPHAEALSSEF